MANATNNKPGNKTNNVNATMKPINATDKPKPPTIEPEPTPEPIETPVTETETESTRKKVKWTRANEILTITFPDGKTANFNIEKVFPGFKTLSTDVMKHIVEYGVKQILADKTAFGKNEKPANSLIIEMMEKRFDDLTNGIIRSNEKQSKTVKIEKSALSAIEDKEKLIAMKTLIDSGMLTGYVLTPEQIKIIETPVVETP